MKRARRGTPSLLTSSRGHPGFLYGSRRLRLLRLLLPIVFVFFFCCCYYSLSSSSASSSAPSSTPVSVSSTQWLNAALRKPALPPPRILSIVLTASHSCSLRLGSTAPDFTAITTKGEINFHEFIGDNYVILFSHPVRWCSRPCARWWLRKSWLTS